MKTNQYRIETRNAKESLHQEWTADAIGDQNEFGSAAEARVAARELRALGAEWAAQDSEYRIVGPQGIESAEMDAEAWQYAIDCQLARLGLSDPDLGRSALVCRIDDAGAVLADVDDWNKPMDPGEICAILEAIDAAQHLDDIREELVSELLGAQ